MRILMPMAGEGKRFADAGYKIPKPLIPTTDRRDGNQYPMVICAMRDVPEEYSNNSQPIFVIRTDYYKDIRHVILKYFPNAKLIGVDHLTEGQACTCLLAKDMINNDESLFIAGCDNGMVYDKKAFDLVSQEADVLVFTYRNDESVLANPNAYGWVFTNGNTDRVTGISVKKPISDNPLNDHAVVASFWFAKGSDFVRCAEEMISANDRVNGEFYVDKIIHYCLKNGLDTRVFEIERYIGWGTPKDYERYEKTFAYWNEFTHSKAFLPQL